jgi:hypothetical protein
MPLPGVSPLRWESSQVRAYHQARAQGRIPNRKGRPTLTVMLTAALQAAGAPVSIRDLAALTFVKGYSPDLKHAYDQCATRLRQPLFVRPRRGYYTVRQED